MIRGRLMAEMHEIRGPIAPLETENEMSRKENRKLGNDSKLRIVLWQMRAVGFRGSLRRWKKQCQNSKGSAGNRESHFDSDAPGSQEVVEDVLYICPYKLYEASVSDETLRNVEIAFFAWPTPLMSPMSERM